MRPSPRTAFHRRLALVVVVRVGCCHRCCQSLRSDVIPSYPVATSRYALLVAWVSNVLDDLMRLSAQDKIALMAAVAGILVGLVALSQARSARRQAASAREQVVYARQQVDAARQQVEAAQEQARHAQRQAEAAERQNDLLKTQILDDQAREAKAQADALQTRYFDAARRYEMALRSLLEFCADAVQRFVDAPPQKGQSRYSARRFSSGRQFDTLAVTQQMVPLILLERRTREAAVKVFPDPLSGRCLEILVMKHYVEEYIDATDSVLGFGPRVEEITGWRGLWPFFKSALPGRAREVRIGVCGI